MAKIDYNLQNYNVTPIWVAYYLGLPYKKKGMDRAGLDDWGLLRMIQAEQFGRALPSYMGLTDEQIAGHVVVNSANYPGWWGNIVVLVTKKTVLFGTKLPGNRMLTMLKSGSCVISFEPKNNIIGED